MLATRTFAVVAERKTRNTQNVVGVKPSGGSNPLNRTYKSGLALQAHDNAKGSEAQGQIFDLLSLYRAAFELHDDPKIIPEAWNSFLDEIEIALSMYVESGFVIKRLLSFSTLLGNGALQ